VQYIYVQYTCSFLNYARHGQPFKFTILHTYQQELRCLGIAKDAMYSRRCGVNGNLPEFVKTYAGFSGNTNYSSFMSNLALGLLNYRKGYAALSTTIGMSVTPNHWQRRIVLQSS